MYSEIGGGVLGDRGDRHYGHPPHRIINSMQLVWVAR